MNSLEEDALGNPVLAGKSSPAPEFSTPNWKYFSYCSPNGNRQLGAMGSGWAWNRLEEIARAEAILSAAGLETAKKLKRTFDRFDGCD